jgi:hypothetical protein
MLLIVKFTYVQLLLAKGPKNHKIPKFGKLLVQSVPDNGPHTVHLFVISIFISINLT